MCQFVLCHPMQSYAKQCSANAKQNQSSQSQTRAQHVPFFLSQTNANQCNSMQCKAIQSKVKQNKCVTGDSCLCKPMQTNICLCIANAKLCKTKQNKTVTCASCFVQTNAKKKKAKKQIGKAMQSKTTHSK